MDPITASVTEIPGLYRIHMAAHSDERGTFGRVFDNVEMRKLGFMGAAQASLSWNPQLGTLRGMHYSVAPESKLVTVVSGHVQDVVIDLRSNSRTFKKWVDFRLTPGEGLLIPPNCAHGFLTLVDNCQLLYVMDVPYVKSFDRGVRFDDPAFSIGWRFSPGVISEKDKNYPDFDPVKVNW